MTKGVVWRGESGLTLAEVLVAVAIVMIGLVALMQFFPMGIQGMETGRQQSTAVFLAEQKMEQIKAWALSTAPNQGFSTVTAGGACFTAGNPCASEAYNTIANYSTYRRTATVSAGSTNTTSVVRVQVFYQPVTAQGVLTAERQVQVATVIASR